MPLFWCLWGSVQEHRKWIYSQWLYHLGRRNRFSLQKQLITSTKLLCPFYAFCASVCSCRCPLIPQGIYLLSQARASRETIMFRPSMNDRYFSIVLSAAQDRPIEMFFQAFYCSQSLRRSSTRGENACLPRNQRASLIAIPTVMAKDEADQ